VELVAPSTVRIEKSVAGGPWQTACTSPCGVELPVDASYRILDGGKQIRGLRLEPGGQSKLVIEVSVGSTAARALGITGLVVGTIVAYAGALAAGSSSNSYSSDGTSPGATAAIILGLGAMIGGGIAVGTSGSSVTQRPVVRETASRRARHADVAPPPRPLDSPPPSRAVAAPLFTFRF
jgi:hypothetical protein